MPEQEETYLIEVYMTTNTFERKIEITDLHSVEKLMDILQDERPTRSISKHPYSAAEREGGEQLFKQFLYRSQRA